MSRLDEVYSLQIERQAALQSARESTDPRQRAGFRLFAGFCQVCTRRLGAVA